MVLPQLGLAYGIKKLNTLFGRNSIWLFTIFYASCFVITSETTGDAARYAEELKLMYDQEEVRSLSKILTFQNGNTDLYQPLITYFVSIFTKSYKLLYVIFGTVLGFFYSRNIAYIIRGTLGSPGVIGIFLILLFSFQVHIGMALNGVRMWTAAHVLIYGLINLFYLSNKKGYIFILLTVLIHYSFIFPVILVFFYKSTKNVIPRKTYLILFILSFFISKIDLATGRTFVSYLPTVFASSAGAYVNEVHEDKLTNESSNNVQKKHWSVNAGKTTKLGLVFIITFLAYFRSNIRSYKFLESLFFFGLLFYSLSNLFSAIPSAGRFFIIAELIIFFIGTKLLLKQIFYDTGKWWFYLLVPLIIVSILFSIRMLLNYPSFWLLLGNPIVAIWSSESQSIYELIGM